MQVLTDTAGQPARTSRVLAEDEQVRADDDDGFDEVMAARGNVREPAKVQMLHHLP